MNYLRNELLLKLYNGSKCSEQLISEKYGQLLQGTLFSLECYNNDKKEMKRLIQYMGGRVEEGSGARSGIIVVTPEYLKTNNNLFLLQRKAAENRKVVFHSYILECLFSLGRIDICNFTPKL